MLVYDVERSKPETQSVPSTRTLSPNFESLEEIDSSGTLRGRDDERLGGTVAQAVAKEAEKRQQASVFRDGDVQDGFWKWAYGLSWKGKPPKLEGIPQP